MTGRAQNPFKSLLDRSETKDKASVRYAIAISSALFFLGWLILELTLSL